MCQLLALGHPPKTGRQRLWSSAAFNLKQLPSQQSAASTRHLTCRRYNKTTQHAASCCITKINLPNQHICNTLLVIQASKQRTARGTMSYIMRGHHDLTKTCSLITSVPTAKQHWTITSSTGLMQQEHYMHEQTTTQASTDAPQSHLHRYPKLTKGSSKPIISGIACHDSNTRSCQEAFACCTTENTSKLQNRSQTMTDQGLKRL